jgi:hypothetical protein
MKSESTETALVIVTRSKLGLYEYATRLLARSPRIRVVRDRRQRDRRQRGLLVEVDWRHADRRSRQGVNDELRSRGWAMVYRTAVLPERPPAA